MCLAGPEIALHFHVCVSLCLFLHLHLSHAHIYDYVMCCYITESSNITEAPGSKATASLLSFVLPRQ